jgi:hypothetical protein
MTHSLFEPEEGQRIKRKHNYELYAMIIHQGYSSCVGHYYCLIKHETGAWIKFDDEKITIIDSMEKLTQLSQKAYICFYEKRWTFDAAADNTVSAKTGVPLRKSMRRGEDSQMLADLESFSKAGTKRQRPTPGGKKSLPKTPSKRPKRGEAPMKGTRTSNRRKP